MLRKICNFIKFTKLRLQSLNFINLQSTETKRTIFAIDERKRNTAAGRFLKRRNYYSSFVQRRREEPPSQKIG